MQAYPEAVVEVWATDEHRVGLKPILRKVWVFDGVAPMLNLINSFRASDHGSNADTDNTGYERIFLAPGAEVRIGPVRSLPVSCIIPDMAWITGSMAGRSRLALSLPKPVMEQ